MKNGLLNILKESINEGGVKKDLYRNLKLAKRNEFYEEHGDFKNQEGYDRAVQNKKNHLEESFKIRLRAYFNYLQTLGNDIEVLKTTLEEKGENSVQGSVNHDESARIYRTVLGGLKLVGLDINVRDRSNVGIMEKIYTLLVNYFHNGGISRDFRKGPIELVPAKAWMIDVDYAEDVVEYGTSYGLVFGSDKEKAQEVILDNPWWFEQDRETHDHDYVGDYKDKEISKVEPKEYTLKPQDFGL
jgi:hypothetical protein